MNGYDLLSLPLLIAAGAALLALLLALAVLGVTRPGREELRAALAAMGAMKWRELAHHVIAMLSQRGLRHDDLNRRPGADGFDIGMTRGAARYLVQCKQGASFLVTAETVREFASLVRLQGAEGGILVTTGAVEPGARRLAARSGIEIVAGQDLWRQLEPLLPLDLLREIRTVAAARRRRRTAAALGVSLAAGLLGFLGAAALGLQPAPPSTAGGPVAEPPVSAPPAQVARMPELQAAVAELPPMPDPTLDEQELAARRAEAERTVRSLPQVAAASWSSRSTFDLGLRGSDEQPFPEATVEAVCREILRYEELRYTRLQVRMASATGGDAGRVRWRQCR